MQILKAIGMRLMYIAIGLGMLAAFVAILAGTMWLVGIVVTFLGDAVTFCLKLLAPNALQIFGTGILLLLCVAVVAMLLGAAYAFGEMVYEDFKKKRGEKL